MCRAQVPVFARDVRRVVRQLRRYPAGVCRCVPALRLIATGILVLVAGVTAADAPGRGWPVYGADAAGTRYSPLAQISRDNVRQLEVAWTYRSGEMSRRGSKFAISKEQNTPITAAGHLIVCTPFNRIVALDPATGAERWAYDPEVDMTLEPPATYACRGVAVWHDRQAPRGVPCRDRLLINTNDLRLIAIDARTGIPCADFGTRGTVSAPSRHRQAFRGEIRYLSPPTVINDVVVIGSAILDNHRIDTPSGRIQAFDIRTGSKLWEFEPILRKPPSPALQIGGADPAVRASSGNAWGTMAADEVRDLLFIPTSSPSPDYYGGMRPGPNRYANSLVVLRGRTGEIIWHYQIVHHDLWDYDVGSQPLLADLVLDGRKVPAVIQNTKQGLVFVFHRETGEPLFPIEERPVPAGDVPGEWYSPTQPIPAVFPALVPQRFSPGESWGFTFWDRYRCRRLAESFDTGGIYTPPSLKGTVTVPWSGGGANWGGAALEPTRNIMVVNTNRIAEVVKIVPITAIDRPAANGGGALDVMKPTRMEGTPYAVRKSFLLSPLGAPCTRPPWGGLTAVDVVNARILWDVPLGSLEDQLPVPLPLRLGTPGMGGPIVTGGGLVFIAAAMDSRFRAFDLATGRELWSDKLPADAQATPMTYEADGRQYVVIAAGGHGQLHNRRGDYVIAYALPQRRAVRRP